MPPGAFSVFLHFLTSPRIYTLSWLPSYAISLLFLPSLLSFHPPLFFLEKQLLNSGDSQCLSVLQSSFWQTPCIYGRQTHYFEIPLLILRLGGQSRGCGKTVVIRGGSTKLNTLTTLCSSTSNVTLAPSGFYIYWPTP